MTIERRFQSPPMTKRIEDQDAFAEIEHALDKTLCGVALASPFLAQDRNVRVQRFVWNQWRLRDDLPALCRLLHAFDFDEGKVDTPPFPVDSRSGCRQKLEALNPDFCTPICTPGLSGLCFVPDFRERCGVCKTLKFRLFFFGFRDFSSLAEWEGFEPSVRLYNRTTV